MVKTVIRCDMLASVPRFVTQKWEQASILIIHDMDMILATYVLFHTYGQPDTCISYLVQYIQTLSVLIITATVRVNSHQMVT